MGNLIIVMGPITCNEVLICSLSMLYRVFIRDERVTLSRGPTVFGGSLHKRARGVDRCFWRNSSEREENVPFGARTPGENTHRLANRLA